VAKYNKKRARELKQDKFRDTTMHMFDRLGDRLAGKGRNILYGIGAAILIAALIGIFVHWRNRKADEARAALGRAIAITQTPVTSSPDSVNAGGQHFGTEQERAQKAIDEFQKVAAKYGDPYRTEARYFIATNLLYVDRNKAMTDLNDLGSNSNKEVAALAKFALGQAKEADGNLDEAANTYRSLASANSSVITPDTANLRLALVLSKQGKKKEASDVLFNIVAAARKAKDSEGNPVPQSQAANDAAEELRKTDPARYEQLPTEAPPNLPF
jgi:TolA-binding protein